MEDDANYRKLIGWGIAYISIHLRSEQEIVAYIDKRAKKISATDEEKIRVLQRLRELGYVDDVQYTKHFIESRQRNHQKGKLMVRLELLKKGVQRDIIDMVYTERDGEDEKSEYTLARTIVQKKYSILGKLPILQQKRRVFGLLQRRGFTSTVISRIIDEMVGKQYN